MVEKKNKGRISKWYAVSDIMDNHCFRIAGYLGDNMICTSPVLNIIDGIAETENSFYTLDFPAVFEGNFEFVKDWIISHE